MSTVGTRAIGGEALLAEADGALYLAKRRGGNRVVARDQMDLVTPRS